jgi:hypothetical protein
VYGMWLHSRVLVLGTDAHVYVRDRLRGYGRRMQSSGWVRSADENVFVQPAFGRRYIITPLEPQRAFIQHQGWRGVELRKDRQHGETLARA